MPCISIVDDEAGSRQFIEKLVLAWTKENKQQIRISSFESAEEFLFKEGDKTTDILLLDIEMNAMNGVELAAKVRKDNRRMQIIFVTGYMDYVQEGYEVEALHYLLKPVSEERLYPVLDRAAERLKTAGAALLLSFKGELVRIPFYEIRYLEVQKNYVTVHGKEAYEVKLPLSELEKELDESFFRTGRSYIVNLKFVRRITKTEVLLEDGSSIPLSRGMYDKINQAMIQYF
ncbi:MAG: response regulator transcription factor [Lachnospiraceae bacterium]|nr:response regulator transcription factor [Lachnospiraceae bacterium]